eukprot:13906389-Alexandrium_andersonii.AAC.1
MRPKTHSWTPPSGPCADRHSGARHDSRLPEAERPQSCACKHCLSTTQARTLSSSMLGVLGGRLGE